MTSAWIAKELGVKKICVNYQLVEFLSRFSGIKQNPMYELEFVKADCDFKKMKEASPEYATEEWFPTDGVEIIESPETSSIKRVTMNMFPESKENVIGRSIDMVKGMVEQVSSLTK